MEVILGVGESFDVYPEADTELEITEFQDGYSIVGIDASGSPPPSGGEVEFESNFEATDFPLWKQLKRLFTNGNTKTHNGPPVPSEMGTGSLRAKQDNGTSAGGEFAPGEYGKITRVVSLAAGSKLARLWRVAHDTGIYVFSVLDKDGELLGKLEGTEGLDETTWRPTDLLFTVQESGSVTLQFEYTAPAQVTLDTGVKVALLQILTA